MLHAKDIFQPTAWSSMRKKQAEWEDPYLQNISAINRDKKTTPKW